MLKKTCNPHGRGRMLRVRPSMKEMEAIHDLIKASGLDGDHPIVRHLVLKLQAGRLEGIQPWLSRLEEAAYQRLSQGAMPFSLVQTSHDGVSLGITTDGVKVGEHLHLPVQTFARHLGVYGLTGSGKTWFMMRLAQQLMAAGITVWIFDRSRDFRRIVQSEGEQPLLYLRPEWLRWNMLQAPGSVHAWTNTLVERMSSVFFSRGGSSVVLSASLEQIYEQQHCTEGGERWPTLDEWWLHLSLSQPSSRSREYGYHESAQRVLRAVHDGFPATFNRKQSVPLAEFAKTSFVIDVSDLSALQYLFILMLLLEQTSSEKYGQTLQRVVFIDEASEIFNEQQMRRQDQGYPPQHDLPRRYRGRGIGLVLADQTPALLPRDVQANLGTLVVFRLLNQACIKAVTASSGMTPEQVDVIASLPQQHAVVHSIDLGKPYLVCMPPMEFPAAPSRADLEARRQVFVPAWMVDNTNGHGASGQGHHVHRDAAASDPAASSTSASAASRQSYEPHSGDPASVDVKDHPCASPEGEYSTNSTLNPDEQRILERIARFPYETIDERCRAEHLDRMIEWHCRKTLSQLGYSQLCGKIGKIEFFSATEKAFSLLASRGIVHESHKGGAFHAVVIKRIADDLAQRMPDVLVKQDGQFSGVQPDMTLTSPEGICVAIQVSITNAPAYEADCAMRLAALHAFQRVLVVCTTEKKVLAVKKAVAQRAGGLFPGDEHGRKVDVVHARVVLEQRMDWQGLLATSRTARSKEQVHGGEAAGSNPATTGSRVGNTDVLTTGTSGLVIKGSAAAAGSADATSASTSNGPAGQHAELRRSEAGGGSQGPEGMTGEGLATRSPDESASPGTEEFTETIEVSADARLAGEVQGAGQQARAGNQEPDRRGRASEDAGAGAAAQESPERVETAEGPEANTAQPARPEGTEDEMVKVMPRYDTLADQAVSEEFGPHSATVCRRSGSQLGGVGTPRIDVLEDTRLKVGSNAAGEPRPGQEAEERLPRERGAKDPDRDAEPEPTAKPRKGTDPEARLERQEERGSPEASESEPKEAGTADAEGSREATAESAEPRAERGTGRPEGGLGEDNKGTDAASQSSDVGRGPGPEPEEGADQTDRPRKPDDREGGRRKGSETRTAGTTRTARTDKPGVRKVSSVKGTTTKAGAYQGGTVLPPEAGIISRQGRVRRNPRAARDDDDDDGTGRTEVVEEYLEGGVSVDEAERVRPIGCTNKNDFEAKAVKEGKKESRRLNLKGERLAVEEHEQKGIDLACEDVISLREAVERLPRRGGKKLHISTLYRWIQSGVRGHRLETIRIGGMQCTSVEALQRFCSNLSDRQPERAPLRVRHGLRKRRTDDILTRAGLLDEPSKGRATRSVKHQTKALEQAKSEADGSA